MNNKISKNTLFLTELIIAILFFALTSVVCVQIFVKAHMLSTQTKQQNFALAQINSFAACVKAENGNIENIGEITNGIINGENNQLEIYFDSNFQNCSKEQSQYSLTATWQKQEKIIITVKDINSPDTIANQQIGYHAPLTKEVTQ